jgi:hypothetical protein
MSRALRGATVLLLFVGVVAGCGGSRQFSPAERAAILAAQRHDGELLIFPSNERGPVRCRPAGRGNPWSHRITNGRCMTFVSLYGKFPVLDFIEGYDLVGHAERGGYLVVLDPHGRIVALYERGLIAANLR